MRTHPRKCNPNKFCLYHRDHGHDMEEYIQLQDEIEELIRRGRLNRFILRWPKDRKDRLRALPQLEPSRKKEQSEDRSPIKIINTISGGPRRRAGSRSVEPSKRQRTEESITQRELGQTSFIMCYGYTELPKDCPRGRPPLP